MDGQPQIYAPPSEEPAGPLKINWQLHISLFIATVFSVFLAGALRQYPEDQELSLLGMLRNLHVGWNFALPLLLILLCHEFGHYIAARLHRVPATLPYFIPLPLLSPFGTMGAVIAMPNRIKSRNALLDIGAAGPLAGMAVAIPVIVIGLMQSEVKVIPENGVQEGQCLLYWLIKRLTLGEIPEGHDVFLTETAFAGWTGFLVTALNLLPISQLDGGHIAYALFGPKQNRYARFLHPLLIGAFLYNVVEYRSVAPGLPWLVWFFLLWFITRRSGMNHPPTEEGDLTIGRKLVGVVCLILFIVLFMPTPLRIYGQ